MVVVDHPRDALMRYQAQPTQTPTLVHLGHTWPSVHLEWPVPSLTPPSPRLKSITTRFPFSSFSFLSAPKPLLIVIFPLHHQYPDISSHTPVFILDFSVPFRWGCAVFRGSSRNSSTAPECRWTDGRGLWPFLEHIGLLYVVHTHAIQHAGSLLVSVRT